MIVKCLVWRISCMQVASNFSAFWIYGYLVICRGIGEVVSGNWVCSGEQTRSKRFLEIQKLRENKKEYDVPTAVGLLKQTASTKFVESAEAHFRLNIDPKYNDQQLRATVCDRGEWFTVCSQKFDVSSRFDIMLRWLQVNLPKGTGQTVKVAVLTQGG